MGEVEALVWPAPVSCHDDLETVCGTCKTFPKAWPAHDWNCRTRGKAVSKHTHACNRYREDQKFVAQLATPLEAENPARSRIEDMELPDSPHWHYRRVEQLLGRKLGQSTAVPPAPRRKPIRGSVYFVDCGLYTKIGHTFDLASRMRSIETHNPFPLKLWGLVAGPVDLERRFHARFYKQRYRNEWFEFSSMNRITASRLILLFGGETYD